MIKIIIVDDHQMVAEGLKNLIESSGNAKVIGTATNGQELLKTLEIVTPDVILMDIDMPVMNGIDAMMHIQKRFPDQKVIILSMHEESSLVKKLTNLGAKGFLFKNSDADELSLALNRVMKGGTYFTSNISLNLINNRLGLESEYGMDDKKSLLTEREIEILKLIAEGLSNKEIGEQLFISHRTVDTHRTNLMKKLDVSNIAGLIRYAIKQGFVR